MTVVRHCLSILPLPGVVLAVVPWLLLSESWRLGEEAPIPGLPPPLRVTFGLLLALAGAVLMTWTIALFARRGRGTLAPWDAPRRVAGPYRHVRNPMISGVIWLLSAETLLFDSMQLARWTLLFVVVNLIYVPLLEEPFLRVRFGAEYERYRRNVPAWLPCMTPWREERTQRASARTLHE